MGVVGHGIDLVECARIAGVLERHGERFMNRILTETERETASRFADPVPHVAGRFAAKEAVLKMLGTGLRGQIGWTDIEIVNDVLGQPQVTLQGECRRIAAERGIERVLLSISHTRVHAAASAIGIGDSS
ncbi:MAG: holo-ACP synthase [Phycisphaerales bacterium]|nr:holo-ACP synthase [Phycisphaerales bacterium]